MAAPLDAAQADGPRSEALITLLAYNGLRIYFRTRDLTATVALRVGSELSYTVRFNVLGPVAKNLSVEAA